MIPTAPLVTAAIVAFLVVLVLTPLVARAARHLGVLDHPNARSSHERVTPRGGGAAIVMGVIAAAFAGRSLLDAYGLLTLGGGLLLAIIGLLDDRYGLGPWVRLGVQTLGALMVAVPTGGLSRLPLPPPADLSLGVLAIPAAAIWVVAVVNFYNFLDGIDGLAAGQAMVTGIGIAAAAWHPSAALMGAAVAGSGVAFLFFNRPPARIFLGDVGSGFLGFTFAALPLLAVPNSRSLATFFVAVSLWLFLADATWTLLRRAWHGARWYEAHREHLYQQLVLAGWTHGEVTLLILVGSSALTMVAQGVWRASRPEWAWAGLGVAASFSLLELALVRQCRRADRRATQGVA